MKTVAIVATVIAVIAVLAIVALIVVALKLKKSPSKPVPFDVARVKGQLGEDIVAQTLGKTESGKQYVINDLLFLDETGNSRQIDHIYINPRGIWVIETKNMSGLITGSDSQREWTQILGAERNTFYNPVKQNITHIYSLAQSLKIKNRDIFQSVVVFLGADISGVSAEGVCNAGALNEIKTKTTGVSLSVKEMEGYYYKLTALKKNCAISLEQHIRNINKKREMVKQGICPRCGGKLVLREGQNGRFYGCERFPDCKFSMNEDDD